MNSHDQTIVSRLTPAGVAALATIGIRGPRALAIARDRFRGRDPAAAGIHRPLYGHFGNSVVDDVVLRVCATEPVPHVEIHCHGGQALVEALLSEIESAGVRRVDWSEFLRHAGEDEIAIEAADALSRTLTARCAAILLDQHQGALRAAFDQIEQTRDPKVARNLLRWRRLGERLVEPWRVAVYGRTNAGKSSLLNALAGFERAIVSEQPGTTRDLLTATVALDGWPVELIDGAGLRDSPDSLEVHGQQLLLDALRRVDLRILVFDTSEPRTPADERLLTETSPDLIVGNKCDLPTDWSDGQLAALHLRVSAVRGDEIGELGRRIAQLLVPDVPPPGAAVPFTARQVEWLQRHSYRSDGP